MIRKLFLPFLAAVGVAFGVFTVIRGNRPTAVALPVADPSQAPYSNYIAGSGILEAQSENIAIGAFTPGVVTRVYVKYGDNVKANDPLFCIDDRELQADLMAKKAGWRRPLRRWIDWPASLGQRMFRRRRLRWMRRRRI